MNVNFEYYRIFYYVAKYHNFTKAAHTLGSSQPNVTRAMNCLEQQINTTLFVRTNRGIQLTPEGEKLYTHISAAMSQIFAAEEELSDSTGLSHGSIAIGVSETALNIFLFNKLKAFHMTYPGIRLKLYNYSTPQAIDAVKSGKIDFAIVSTPASVESPLRQIMLQPFQEILVVLKLLFVLILKDFVEDVLESVVINLADCILCSKPNIKLLIKCIVKA